ncbi:MAG: hypothetical protein U5R49_01710 [Deltaproteobacteria bacterium]|nr:hypothetical protein [Deltaproteobacteria bacterium]
MMRYFLFASTLFVKNPQSETLLREIKASYRSQFGRMNITTLLTSSLVVFFSMKESLRCRLVGDLRVPKTAYDPSYIHASPNHRPVRTSSLYTEGLTPKIPRLTEQPGH